MWIVMRMREWDVLEISTNLPDAPAYQLRGPFPDGSVGFLSVFNDHSLAIEASEGGRYAVLEVAATREEAMRAVEAGVKK